MIYNELMQRGTANFPIELYTLDKTHPRYEMAAHWHSDIELVRVLEGELHIRLDAREYIAKKGDVLFINAEVVHAATPGADCLYECIVMKLDMLSTEDAACSFFIDALFSHDAHVQEFHRAGESQFTRTATNLFEALPAHTTGQKFLILGILYSLFSIILNDNLYISTSSSVAFLNDKNIAKLKNVLLYIRENYDKAITLGDIAKHSKMSPQYLCTFFRKMTNKTPIDFLISHRIECAARKLINTSMDVTEIALSCGFNDISYFIKAFKSHKGITPAKFRNL